MAGLGRTVVYLCPNCLNSEESEGPCSVCGTLVVECNAGEPGDPGRRPLIDEKGRVRSRAPIWWLNRRVNKFIKYVK